MILLQILEEKFLLRSTEILNENFYMRKYCFDKGFSQLKLARKLPCLLPTMKPITKVFLFQLFILVLTEI